MIPHRTTFLSAWPHRGSMVTLDILSSQALNSVFKTDIMCPVQCQLEGDGKEIWNMVHSSGNAWMTWTYQKAWPGKKCSLSNGHLDQGLASCAHSPNLANSWYRNKHVLGQLHSPIYRLSVTVVLAWQCDSMAKWECGYMAVWLCHSVTVW